MGGMVNRYNLLGPTNQNDGDVEIHNKWIVTALVAGFFGGGLIYILYRRRTRIMTHPAAIPSGSGNANRSLRSNQHKQPQRSNCDHEFSCIRDLPTEIRTKIWQTLPYDDLLSLRLTSSFTKDDVDTFVGLHGRVTATDTEKYEFFQRIALQSCKITDLRTSIDPDFFLNPTVLQHLEIREYIPIPLENISQILSMCINLKHLKLRLTLNDHTEQTSQVILQNIVYMKGLTVLHIKTKPRYIPEHKIVPINSSLPFQCNAPKKLKHLHLEMPDIPAEELTRWRVVLEKQKHLEMIMFSLGNVSWRFYENTLMENGNSLHRVALEGIRGWSFERNAEDPLDWGIFANCVRLTTVDLSCNRGGEHDVLASQNFEMFPCGTIEQFFISRITLNPQAVERIYREMARLQRGALDHIGHPGIERANEMAWMVQHAENDRENMPWWQNEQLWDFVAHGIFGLTLASVLTFVVRSRGGSEGLIGETFHFLSELGDQVQLEGRNETSFNARNSSQN